MKSKRSSQSTFYDQLEAFASSRTPCAIIFMDQNDQQEHTMGLITEFFERDKIDYLKLDNGKEIRIDRIVNTNGLSTSDFGGIC
ncbi:hypothetical protein [Solitalea canadensis]|uniref:Uncharacterized protein n=1 Tax=Solitalea canadensis (strain ATCC 29591 / DSM 3403 / JCM 21819 / LMG 8368 / NBRC 15130 / NCIMB 12057 / USAM 9D) TaxID=929556 RepID=H8KLQ0_SOLCM|nr:hypothetical protein [Solitalea canadensis]AFD09204.1 hypothetical protein Solca_4214 [Solitalea canadensis DSM 3403]